MQMIVLDVPEFIPERHLLKRIDKLIMDDVKSTTNIHFSSISTVIIEYYEFIDVAVSIVFVNSNPSGV